MSQREEDLIAAGLVRLMEHWDSEQRKILGLDGSYDVAGQIEAVRNLKAERDELQQKLNALLKACKTGPIMPDPHLGKPNARWVCFRDYQAVIDASSGAECEETKDE